MFSRFLSTALCILTISGMACQSAKADDSSTRYYVKGDLVVQDYNLGDFFQKGSFRGDFHLLQEKPDGSLFGRWFAFSEDNSQACAGFITFKQKTASTANVIWEVSGAREGKPCYGLGKKYVKHVINNMRLTKVEITQE